MVDPVPVPAPVPNPLNDLVRQIAGYIPATLGGQPTEYIAGGAGIVSLLFIKGGLKMPLAIAGLGLAGILYYAKTLPVPAAYGYVYNEGYGPNVYGQQTDIYP